jgi:pantetheine-phosphate adenylyltransferase
MLIKKQHKDLIASTKDRIRQVETYLQSVKRSIQHQVVPIKDPFGPTVTDPTIDALVVSKETRKGGDLGKVALSFFFFFIFINYLYSEQ